MLLRLRASLDLELVHQSLVLGRPREVRAPAVDQALVATRMDTINSTCYPHHSNTDIVDGRVKIVLLTLTGRLRWQSLAICLSMAAFLLIGCGSEAPETDTSASRQTSTPIVPAAATETQQPTAAPIPTSSPTQMPVEIGHEVGQRAPDFMLTTVEGEQVTLASFQGRPVVLYFYTTW